MRATSTFNFEVGISTRAWRAFAALRIRVSKSEMGSVCIIVFSPLLPASFHYAGNLPAQSVSAETNAAQFKLTDKTSWTSAQAAAVTHANLEFRLPAHLGKLRISRNRCSSSFFLLISTRLAGAAARPAVSKARGLLRHSWPSSS